MADILIKGMEMPKNNESIKVFIITSEGVFLMVDEGKGKKLDAVEVPPHGRLIDAKLLASTHWESQQVIYAIKDAPTVLEASDNNDDDNSYEKQSDMRDYCERYEPTYNPEDGSM